MDETWEERGCGVHVMRRSGREVVLGDEGTDALECIDVPVAFFDPFRISVAWANAAFERAFHDGTSFRDWLELCRRTVDAPDDSALRQVMLAVREARALGDSIDICAPRSVVLPFCESDLPSSWTLHCHAVSFRQGGRTAPLMTIQAPSLTVPPRQVCSDSDTATDHVIRLIDRAIDNSASEKLLLLDLRDRVLAGRMNEPMGSTAANDDSFPWDTSASLAMMLGLPFGQPGRHRISGDATRSPWTAWRT